VNDRTKNVLTVAAFVVGTALSLFGAVAYDAAEATCGGDDDCVQQCLAQNPGDETCYDVMGGAR
jgi:hypothetical protein